MVIIGASSEDQNKKPRLLGKIPRPRFRSMPGNAGGTGKKRKFRVFP
ncbi:outer membrane porin OpcP domain protein [Burkholderia pseudomallei MSHR5596]|nr:outer membrane porin OpcP domain protein [Burkholderia pseudomallei MSHR5596]